MTTQTLTLTDFLLARIAEQEAAAFLGGVAVGWVTFRRPDGQMDHTALGTPTEEGWIVDGRLVQDERAEVFYDPARVLAECEAKRRIVALHPITDRIVGYGSNPYSFGCEVCHDWDGVTTGGGYCETLRTLALSYADHPDYREEWRP